MLSCLVQVSEFLFHLAPESGACLLYRKGKKIRMDRMLQWDSQEYRLSKACVLIVSSLWNFQSSWCLLFWWWLLNLSSDQLPVTLYIHVFVYRLIIRVFSFLERNILYEYKRWTVYLVLQSQAKVWELVGEDFSDTLCVLLVVCCVGTCTAQLLKRVSPSIPRAGGLKMGGAQTHSCITSDDTWIQN